MIIADYLVTVDSALVDYMANMIYALIGISAILMVIFVVGFWFGRGIPISMMMARFKGKAVAFIFDKMGTISAQAINYKSGFHGDKDGFFVVDHRKFFIGKGGAKITTFYDGSIYSFDIRDTVVVQKLMNHYKVKTLKALKDKLKLEQVIQLTTNDGKIIIDPLTNRIRTIIQSNEGEDIPVSLGMEQVNGTEIIKEMSTRDNATPSNVQAIVNLEIMRATKGHGVNIKVLIIVGIFIVLIAVGAAIALSGGVGSIQLPGPSFPSLQPIPGQTPPLGIPIPGLTNP